jgi:hypothetical protein
MIPEPGAVIFSLAAFVCAWLFWWFRQLGIRDGRMGLGISPSFSRDEHPKVFGAISWFYVFAVIYFVVLGVFSLTRKLFGL